MKWSEKIIEGRYLVDGVCIVGKLCKSGSPSRFQIDLFMYMFPFTTVLLLVWEENARPGMCKTMGIMGYTDTLVLSMYSTLYPTSVWRNLKSPNLYLLSLKHKHIFSTKPSVTLFFMPALRHNASMCYWGLWCWRKRCDLHPTSLDLHGWRHTGTLGPAVAVEAGGSKRKG